MLIYPVQQDTILYPGYPGKTTLSLLHGDSLIHHKTLSETAFVLPCEERSPQYKETNVIFLIFLLCFLMIAFAFLRGKQMIARMTRDLFQAQSHSSIFFETTGNDFRNKLILFFQSIIISSIFVYTCLIHLKEYTPDVTKSLLLIGCFSGLIFIYFLYKWIFYKIISSVFFNRNAFEDWMNTCISLVSFHGLIMFFPVFLSFYIPNTFYFALGVVFLWFVVISVIIIYKSYVIFFNNLNYLHYLFLYLCAQEIIPLFLLYKGVIYIFNLLETGILWV